MDYIRAGVLLLVCFVHPGTAKSCHYNNLYATFDWVTVRSPGYPGRFPAQTQCWWKITAPDNYKVQLEFTDFDLVKPNGKNQCIWQWLNVMEGPTDPEEGEAPMLTLCGSNRPRLVISSTNALRLNLHSNAAAANSRYRGFSARYKYTQDDPYMPTKLSSLLPDSYDTEGMPDAPSRPAEGPSRSVGDAIAPFAKSKPLPPNPNAVLTLKNRRTEAQNRLRNSGISSDNNARNNPGFPGDLPRRPPPSNSRLNRPRPMTTVGNRVLESIPPKRRPLRREYKILLVVLGTIAGLALVLFLVKKFAFDKAHKSKRGEGKVMHAYAHFRRFKKTNKKNNDVEANKATGNSGTGTRDSGSMRSEVTAATERKSGTLENDVEDFEEQSLNNRGKKENLPDVVMVHETPVVDSSVSSSRRDQKPPDPQREHVSQTRAGTFGRNTHLPGDALPRDATYAGTKRRRRRRHRQREEGDRMGYRHKHSDDIGQHSRDGHSSRYHRRPNERRRRRSRSSSPEMTPDHGRHTFSWRDRAYS